MTSKLDSPRRPVYKGQSVTLWTDIQKQQQQQQTWVNLKGNSLETILDLIKANFQARDLITNQGGYLNVYIKEIGVNETAWGTPTDEISIHRVTKFLHLRITLGLVLSRKLRGWQIYLITNLK